MSSIVQINFKTYHCKTDDCFVSCFVVLFFYSHHQLNLLIASTSGFTFIIWACMHVCVGPRLCICKCRNMRVYVCEMLQACMFRYVYIHSHRAIPVCHLSCSSCCVLPGIFVYEYHTLCFHEYSLKPFYNCFTRDTAFNWLYFSQERTIS